MIGFRPLDDNFQIDGVTVTKPYNFETTIQIISTDDSGRLAGNGAMQIDFLTHVYVTTWTYGYMTGDEYDLIYQNYILNTIKNENMYHTLKTIDSNTRKSLTYKIYTQDQLKAELYKCVTDEQQRKEIFGKLKNEPVSYMGLNFVNEVAVYKDVVFTFVGVGGESL